MIKNDEDYLIRRTYTNYGGVNMAFDLTDEELQATREMNKTAWESEIDKWSREYLIERYKDLVEIEKEHKKENGELREEVEKLEEEDTKIRAKFILSLGNYISKDKIREKIEELEKEIEEKQENCLDFTLIHEHEIDTNGIIKVLQELLEERN